MHIARLEATPIGDASFGPEFDTLVSSVLEDDPSAGVEAVTAALQRGVALAEIGRAIAHASVLRIGRFHTSNEFADWDAVHNTWTSCQALAQALARAPSRELARGLYHAAIRIYLDRFLNVPAARLPDERPSSTNGRASATSAGDLLELMDSEQQVTGVALLVDAAIAGGQSDQVIRTLGRAVLREDSDFHGYQTLEAGIQQFNALRSSQPLAARRTLVSVSRYVAAHAPTPRALQQTYQIAVRLLRGDDLTVAVDEADA